MLKVKRFEFNPFPVNTYLLIDSETNECVVIDPGCYYGEEQEELQDYITRNNLHVIHLLATHLHLDHIFGIPFVSRTYGVDFTANAADNFLMQAMADQAVQYGMKIPDPPIPIACEIVEGDKIKIGKHEITAIHIPGHSPGSMAYYCADSSFIVVGDVLFKGSIGRCDLPKGDERLLLEGIRKKLFTLPLNTVVLPGHGEQTTIGDEIKYNPFFN